MTTPVPADLTNLPVRHLDVIRSAIGGEKLAIRRTALRNRRMLDKQTIKSLRPYNVAIDRINAEEARREEAAYQQRMKVRAEKTKS